MLRLNVNGQSISCEYSPVAGDSIDYLTASFCFSPDWFGLTKTAQFTQNGTTYNVVLDADKCMLPSELCAGNVEISVFGQQSGASRRITTLACGVNIRKSGFHDDGTSPIPPTPDLYAQLLEKMEQAVPKSVSQLKNDVGYITQDAIPQVPGQLSFFENDTGYITEQALPKKLSQLENDSNFATTEQLPQIPGQLSFFENDTGYITEQALPKKLSQLENDSNFATTEQLPQIPSQLSFFENDVRFVKASDLCTVFTFPDYSNFYSAIAGSYLDITNWIDGQIIRIEDSAVPLLYVQKKKSDINTPATEEECIALLETNGYVGNWEVTFRKYSEILGGDLGDVGAALDSIIAIQNSLIGGDA